MVKTRHRRPGPTGAPDRFRQWLAEGEESGSEEDAPKVEWASPEGVKGLAQLESRETKTGQGENYSEEAEAVNKEVTGNLVNTLGEELQEAEMGRGTAAKVSKSHGPSLKNAAKGLLVDSWRPQVSSEDTGRVALKDAGAVPNHAGAPVSNAAAPLSDIVGMEPHSPMEGETKAGEQSRGGERKLPGNVVHFSAVLSGGASEGSSSEDYSSAEEEAGPLVPVFNPFKSKLAGGLLRRKPAEGSADVSGASAAKRPVENGVASGVSEDAAQEVGGAAVASKAETAFVEKTGVEQNVGGENGDSKLGKEGHARVETEDTAERVPSEKASETPSKEVTEKLAPPEQDQKPGLPEQKSAANPNDGAASHRANATPEGPVIANAAEKKPNMGPQVAPAHVARALKQMPGDIVAEIDAIAERITSQGGSVPPVAPKKSEQGLPPRNSFSPGAAYLKLHSQGDSSLKSPEGKAKHPIVSAFRDRAHSTSSMPEGGAGEPPGKGPVPNFWSRFIPVHAFQPGEGGAAPAGAPSPPGSAVIEELPEGDEVRSRGRSNPDVRVMQRSVSEISPGEGAKLVEEVGENHPDVAEKPVEENLAAPAHYARSKSLDSGGASAKGRTPSSPMSVLPPRSGEATSPRSPHSPTKPPLPPILKATSRFNGGPSGGNSLPTDFVEEMKDLDLREGQGTAKPPSPPGVFGPAGGRLSPNGGRKDSPRRVSFVDDLPTLRKANSFSPGSGSREGGPAQGLPKSVSMPRNAAGLAAAAAEAEAKLRGRRQGDAEKEKPLDAAEILQTSDTDELFGAFGAAGMDLDGLIKMAEVHLREARKGMSPEPKKSSRSPRDDARSPEPRPVQEKEKLPAEKARPNQADVKTPYLSIPDFDEEEWSGGRGNSPTPKGKATPRGGRGDDALAASQKAWEKKSREQSSRSLDSSAINRATNAPGRQPDGTGRHSEAQGRHSDAIGRPSDGHARRPDGSRSNSDGSRTVPNDFGRSSLERLDPVLDTVLERVLAGDEFESALGSETAKMAENGEVKGRGKEVKAGQEVIFWGNDDDAEREMVSKLEKEKESLQASLNQKAGNSADADRQKRMLHAKRAQLEADITQLQRKVSLQRSMRSTFTAGQRGGFPDGNRGKEDAEIRQLEDEVAKMKRTKEELVGTLESAREAEGAAEKIWELQETRAQLEEDLARLMAQKAAGAFKPAVNPEQAQLEGDINRMKQELTDLEKQRDTKAATPEAQLERLKEERSMLELKLANAIGEIALEAAMSPRGPAPSPDEFEELNLGLLEEGNSRLQQQIQEVKQQAARQRAGIIIGSEERTQALQKLLETRNLYEEELAATVQQIMEEKKKNDEIEKMVHGNMSALERALAQQQQALSEAQEVLQAERMRSQTMRASVENISQAAAPAIPGLLKGRAYAAAANAPQPQPQLGRHFSLNFANLETGGSDYLTQQLSQSRGLVFRESEIRRRIHDDGSDSESGNSHTSASGDNFADRSGGELALPAPKGRITELSSERSTVSSSQARVRPEILLSNRESPRSPSGPQLVGGSGLGFQLEHSQERRNQILKQFSGPLDPPVRTGSGASSPGGPNRMSVAASPKQQTQRPKSAGTLRGNNRYSLG